MRQRWNKQNLVVHIALVSDSYLPAEIANGDEQVKVDAIRIGNYKDGQYPTDSREFAKRIFYTVFMGSENRQVINFMFFCFSIFGCRSLSFYLLVL